ncbi:MAG: sporulation protein YqfD [Eubacterium sp.]|nr:sporulation protein YqfD [Eubacterium sp.]
MVRFFRWLLGYVEFAFLGGFIDGFVNDCYQNKINVHSLKKRDKTLYGECLYIDFKRMIEPAEKNGGELTVVKKRGIIFPLMKLKNRWGLFCGALIFVCLISFLSGFIWKVEIVGNSRISSARIISFLEENNIKRGAPWRLVDKNKTENLMLASFEDCAWVHINELGTTARVEINESVLKPKLKSKTAANVKAKKDGFIIKTSVTNGWQVAKAGDSVTKGDLLISGIYESEKKKGNQFAHASGEFIAEVKEKISLTVSRKQTYKSYKDEKTFRKILFFGAEIPLYIIPFETKNADIKAKSEYLSLNSVELPIGIKKINVRNYDIKSRILSDSELEKLLESELEKTLKNDFSNSRIIKKNLKTSLESNQAKISGEIICLEDIAKEVKIKIKKK